MGRIPDLHLTPGKGRARGWVGQRASAGSHYIQTSLLAWYRRSPSEDVIAVLSLP